MLHNLACVAIAYFLARHLNARFPSFLTAVWSSAVAAIAGIVIGSVVVLGGMVLMGFQLDPGAVAGRGFAQSLIWSVAGTAAGIFHGRQKAATGEHGSVTSIPAVAWLGWGVLTVAMVFGIIALAGKISVSKPSTVGNPDPQLLNAPMPSPAVQQPPATVNWGDFTPVHPPAVQQSPATVNWDDFTPVHPQPRK